MKEVWKSVPIEEYKDYEVSNLGRARHNGRILKGSVNKHGYVMVHLSGQDGQTLTTGIHRLVALAFVPNDDPEHKTQCNHINEKTTDNRAVNLNWMTPKENTNWGTGHQRGVDKKKVPVLKTKGKEVIGFYSSAADAQKEGGFDRRKISDVCNGRKQSHKGFGWEFADFGFLFWYYKKKVFSLWPRPKL